MSEIRQDLIDRGVYSVPGREPRQAGRTVPRLYEGGEMPAGNSSTLALDIKGQPTDKEADAVAKRVQGTDRVRYYLKVSTDGGDRGHLLDPRGMYFEKRHLTAVQARRGQSKYEFKEVKEPAFRDYLNYLSTKDASYLRSADREVLNG